MARITGLRRGISFNTFNRPAARRATKQDFCAFCADNAIQFEIVDADAGQWNSRREVYVNGVMVANIMRGERADWDRIIEDVDNAVR